jgi:dsDNA-specific endonuclease/ATPase MutS2
MQSVSGDLSTFSGHLVVCREILRCVKETFLRRDKADGMGSDHTRHSLVLLDEIGTGTDPAQVYGYGYDYANNMI